MGSMDSSRIGQFFGLAPKMANPAESAGANDKGGFADLLFGVMTRRVSTAQPALSVTKVSTVLPMAEGPANTGTSTVPAPNRKLEATRLPGAATRRDDTPVATAPAAGTAAKGGSDKAVADQQKQAADGLIENQGGPGDVAEAAPPADGAAPEDAAGDTAGEEIDLEGDAEGGDSAQSDIGQDGSEQAPDQNAAVIVIEPQVIAVAAPVAEGGPSVVAAQAAALPAISDMADPVQAPASDATAPLIPTQPLLSADTGAGQAATPTPTPAAQPETPAAADAEAPAEAAPAAADKTATDEAAFAALALAADPAGDEAEAQAAVLARQTERRGEEMAAMFRRPAQTPRQRAAAASAGAANAAAQPAANIAVKTPVTPTAASTAGTAATTVLPLAPVGFETGLGSAPGMPGWTLNLAQGNAARRPDFIANLRQHLQNLPAHEQMALGIQRSARDGGGRITLQLSPTELGRIHLKLDIDEEKNVRASVSVERPATLELLQRDTKALERALQDAGLKMDQNDLSFSLHGGDSDSFAREFGGEGRELADLLTDGAEDDPAPGMAAQAAVIATADGLVDVQV